MIIKKQFKYGEHNVTLETGIVARQADAAVMVTMDDTVVLVTVVVEKKPKQARDFFPLTVNYIEKYYAAGRIPGGFLKREGRPSDNETLTSRLIDRPVRPLFPEDFTNEMQVVATVMSYDPKASPDIAALIGASAALSLCGAPFKGPIGAARVGYKDGVYLLNPSAAELADSKLDLVVAGTESAVLMVESEAQELHEDVMLTAVLFGHEQMQVVIKAIKEMKDELGKPEMQWQPAVHDHALEQAINQQLDVLLRDVYLIREKLSRYKAIHELRGQVIANFVTGAEGSPTEEAVSAIFSKLESEHVRGKILAGEERIDGRSRETVRPISIKTGILPRVHGSALFTRGETQAIVVTTLGTKTDAQMLDGLSGNSKDQFMFHYNFPPYCVGEMGQMGSPKRREVGHGRLAKRGINPVLPTLEQFPYVLRVVSEITESNGSSSMASVCGSSLALMEAGVPIKGPVAGIAMGLIKEGEKFAVLTDILGDEDHLGDMDFKVAGTKDGVTALQMDIKIDGITKEIMAIALEQARAGRLHILGEMAKVISAPKNDVSSFAPRITNIQIPKDKIRDVIGKGGAVIRAIIEETGATIDISDEGVVSIAAVDMAQSEAARKKIESITADVEAGKVYTGKVVKLMDFGAFVNLLPGKDGLLHVSQISEERVQNVGDYLTEGQEVTVIVLEIDRQGKIKLSMKPSMMGESSKETADESFDE